MNLVTSNNNTIQKTFWNILIEAWILIDNEIIKKLIKKMEKKIIIVIAIDK